MDTVVSSDSSNNFHGLRILMDIEKNKAVERLLGPFCN